MVRRVKDEGSTPSSSSERRSWASAWGRMADAAVHREYQRVQAKIMQDVWSSWARYKSFLTKHRWESFRDVFGYKGKQKNPTPGPPARGKPPTEK